METTAGLGRLELIRIAESVAQVEALVAREAERGIAADRLLLAGFSQGGAIALAAGIARTQPLAGLIALSTYLPMAPAQARAALRPEATSQPVFMAHGQFDPVVPYAGGDMSANALRALGFDVQWHRYPMQHAVCAEEIRDLGDWNALDADRARELAVRYDLTHLVIDRPIDLPLVYRNGTFRIYDLAVKPSR